MIAIDLTHTTHTDALSGIQQVSRELYRALQSLDETVPIVFDRYSQIWRTLDDEEERKLTREEPPANLRKRSASWSRRQKFRGKLRRWFGEPRQLRCACDFCVLPELFGPERQDAFRSLQAISNGPLVAVFHDAIALRYPEWTPRRTVEWYPEYLKQLRQLDAIAAVSESSKLDLQHFWNELGLGETPSPIVESVHLGTRFQRSFAEPIAPTVIPPEPMLLMVGTFEARKNHLATLQAAESLWKEGAQFRLVCVGMLNRETGAPAWKLLGELQAAGRPLEHRGSVSREALEQAYAECYATLYPSLYEGFGMPVLESLSHGKPCICSNRGGLDEIVHDGGCLLVDVTSESIARGIRELIHRPDLHAQLTREARARKFRSFQDQAREILHLASVARKRRRQ